MAIRMFETFEYPILKNMPDIKVNLLWHGFVEEHVSGLFKKKTKYRAVLPDYDMCCVYEMLDGTTGIIDSKIDLFGDYDNFPFVNVDKDDKSGNSVDGETITVNGNKLSEFNKIVIYARISDWSDNWNKTDSKIICKFGSNLNEEIIMNEFEETDNIYGIISIILNDGYYEFSSVNKFYPDSQSLIDDFGINYKR